MKILSCSQTCPSILSRLGKTVLPVALAIASTLSILPTASLAQTFIPPARGMPGRREGGGTRGCWEVTNGAFSTRLTALVPTQNFGYTLDDYPAFFVYIPEAYAETAVGAEFILESMEGDRLYQVAYETAGVAGMVKIALPADANVAPLEVGQDYHWSFSLICNPNDRSSDLVVDSWIQRIEPDSALAAQIEATSADALPNLFAEAGIWYDSIGSLADLDADTSRWQALLDSVNLSDVARSLSPEPLTMVPSESADTLPQ